MNGIFCRTYSLWADGDKEIRKNFKVKEFRCKNGADPIIIADDLVYWLYKVREHFGKPVIINSAYRTPEYNAKIGGAKRSQHMYGTAADFHINGVPPADIVKYLETVVPNTCGIGLYDEFVHLDVRRKKTRWNG